MYWGHYEVFAFSWSLVVERLSVSFSDHRLPAPGGRALAFVAHLLNVQVLTRMDSLGHCHSKFSNGRKMEERTIHDILGSQGVRSTLCLLVHQL